MKRLLTILVLLPIFAGATVYTWSSASTNILINNTIFGTLHAGDTVNIPFRSGGYRSYYLKDLNNGGAGNAPIYIVWSPLAYITPSASALLANGIENCVGVYTYGMKMDDHVDAAMRLLGSAYCSYITWDSCHYRGMPGFGPVQGTSAPAFGGDSTHTFHHWRWVNCVFDSLYGSNDGGLAIAIGGNAAGTITPTANWWKDNIIENCYFGHYSSNTVASNYIRLLQSANDTIRNNRFEWLGMVLHPTGHAAQIISIASRYIIYNNYHGPFNFGNEVRDLGPVDFPMWGANYSGRSIFAGILVVNKRKYPVIEFQDINSGILSSISAYAQSRTTARVYNVTAYNLSPGINDGPYETNIVDCYKTDSVLVKNCTVVGVRDGTWASAYGPFLYSAAVGPIGFIDTASNRMTQLWVNSGIQDSVTFTPIPGGTLNDKGVSAPSVISRDYYGNPRPFNGLYDIGAIEFFLSNCNCAGPSKVRIVGH